MYGIQTSLSSFGEHIGRKSAFSMWLKNLEGKVSVKLEYRAHFSSQTTANHGKTRVGVAEVDMHGGEMRKRFGQEREWLGKKDIETSIVKVIEGANPGKASRYQLFSPLFLPKILNTLLYYLFPSTFLI